MLDQRKDPSCAQHCNTEFLISNTQKVPIWLMSVSVPHFRGWRWWDGEGGSPSLPSSAPVPRKILPRPAGPSGLWWGRSGLLAREEWPQPSSQGQDSPVGWDRDGLGSRFKVLGFVSHLLQYSMRWEGWRHWFIPALPMSHIHQEGCCVLETQALKGIRHSCEISRYLQSTQRKQKTSSTDKGAPPEPLNSLNERMYSWENSLCHEKGHE